MEPGPALRLIVGVGFAKKKRNRRKRPLLRVMPAKPTRTSGMHANPSHSMAGLDLADCLQRTYPLCDLDLGREAPKVFCGHNHEHNRAVLGFNNQRHLRHGHLGVVQRAGVGVDHRIGLHERLRLAERILATNSCAVRRHQSHATAAPRLRIPWMIFFASTSISSANRARSSLFGRIVFRYASRNA